MVCPRSRGKIGEETCAICGRLIKWYEKRKKIVIGFDEFFFHIEKGCYNLFMNGA